RALWKSATTMVSLPLPRRRECDPPALLHAAVAGFGEGDVANAGREVARKRRAGRHMAQEGLPSDAVGIAVAGKRRHVGPAAVVIRTDILHHAEMGDRRCLRDRLHAAAMQV